MPYENLIDIPTKEAMLRFLTPFADEIELYVWRQEAGVWRPAVASAEYSARAGKTYIWISGKSKQVEGKG